MSSPSSKQGAPLASEKRETFSSRKLFILSAVGSAVGLGNIWRFPYVAYENGGGAFLIPYLVAILCAGIPLLFLDYSIGHRYRGSAPLAYRRANRKTEMLGWWQVLICFVIAIYYAAIVAWAAMYCWFSITKAWESNPEGASGFFMQDFLKVSDDVNVSFDFVGRIFVPMLIVWLITMIIMVAGVNKGISRANAVFMPLLIVMFMILVVQSVFLPGAVDGLNAFFTPNFEALQDPAVWAAAFGHIFFSLSVAFGIMVTYSSYMKRKSDLTGSGYVVAFANSGFELLAGIGVFAALGFMAHNAGSSVDEVATSGIGLAFIAFPTIVSQAPLGGLIGVLFFGSLVFAGLTSLISILEVIVAAFQDKLGWKRTPATLVVVLPVACISLILFPTTTGLYLLDTMDAFVNQFGILACALVLVIVFGAGLGMLPKLAKHLNRHSSIKLGTGWKVLVGGIGPAALGYMLINEVQSKINESYSGYPLWFNGVFGWGMAGALIVGAVILSFVPWSKNSKINDPEFEEHQQNVEAEELPDPVGKEY
ncbi:sodium-dependent transporter [Arthrobacter sp. NIO-1057]|uniref:sodium-dependent transporter n=1 Tax=Arthrobacter sp. NIO-1057 TaxID=993071 RepID=UPI00071DCCA1|nr:sodium-dependent transporter [Arthrobacter sp. NIO-1057]KSU67289.1 transporter [Arthrobacter sp. NIO-1057]SCC03120.1 neurotransmitter:Na+ symporter, NSS family [Arthrobacter sp. NIO-1057]